MPLSDQTLPNLSVVLPTYNRRDSLRITLEAFARQTYPSEKFEVIAVSDGSTDGTDDYLCEAARTMPYTVRPLFQTNAGPARARNNGVRAAHGRVIVFVDDDVEPAPEFLSCHAAHHEDDSPIAVVGPMLPDPARRNNEPVWIAWEHAMVCKQYDNWRTGVWPGVGPNHFYSGNASLRRADMLAVGGFDESFKRQEDVEMAYRLYREFDLRFRFDAAATGIHRPQRTFDGWLRIPYAYGGLDVVRARRGDVSWELLWQAYHGRNKITRHLIDSAFALPVSAPVSRGLLLYLARILYGLHRDAAAIALMSAVYNVHYLEGARAEMGGDKLVALLRAAEPPQQSVAIP